MARTLSYWDRFTQYLTNAITSNTDGDSIFNELELPMTVKTSLVLELTGEEYTKMFSALMTGADLKFQNEAHEITWLLWKAAKSMEFCDQVAACISGGGASTDAVADIVTTTENYYSGGNNTTVINNYEQNRNRIPETYSCDNDHKFATARAIVQALHDATIEVFQLIEVVTNPLEAAAELSDNIPVVGSVTATALDIVTWIQESAYEVYVLAWSDVVRDEIACEIYCAMQDFDPCFVSLDVIRDVYQTGLPNPPGVTDSFVDWAVWIMETTLSLSDTNIVKLCNNLGIAAMYFGSKFGMFGLGVRTLDLVIELAKDETSNDWEALCTECPANWSHTWNFATHANAYPSTNMMWTTPAYGQYEVGVGITAGLDYREAGKVSNTINSIAANNWLPPDTSVRGWEVFCLIDKGLFVSNTTGIIMRQQPFSELKVLQAGLFNGEQSYRVDFPSEITGYMRFEGRISKQNDPPPGYLGEITIVAITMYGDGEVDPYGAQDNGEKPW